MDRHGRHYVRAEAERVGESGLLVAEECDNTRTRESARRLRRKIASLLRAMSAPLTLDFTGVDRASSSFLDELLGRLARELGPKAFAHRVEISGMASLIANQANVVIAQRLERYRPSAGEPPT